MANFLLRRVPFNQQIVNAAEAYGVRVERTTVKGMAWRAVYVGHLTPAENGGDFHVWVDTLDTTGELLRRAVRYDWAGMRPDETPQPPEYKDEPGRSQYDIPMNSIHQVTSVWVDGASSDKVIGLSTNHPDEAKGNTLGHHSFYVVFQWCNLDQTVIPVKPPSPPVHVVPTPEQAEDALEVIEGLLLEVTKQFVVLRDYVKAQQ